MTKEELIKKLEAGGQITVEDIKSLGKKRAPDERPAKVCSPKHAVAKAKKGQELNKWELEELAKDPEHAFAYAKLKGKRFPECEHQLFLKGGENVSDYFIEVVKEKDEAFEAWLLGQKNNGKHNQPDKSFKHKLTGNNPILRYSRDILKARWKEGEKVLLKKTCRWSNDIDLDDAWEYYDQFIGDGPWAEMERVLFNKKLKVSYRENNINKYFKLCKPGRQEDTERRLMKSGNTYAIFMYAKHCVCGRLPDALHNRMVLGSSKAAKGYVKWLRWKRDNVAMFLQTLDEEDREKVISMIPEGMAATG